MLVLLDLLEQLVPIELTQALEYIHIAFQPVLALCELKQPPVYAPQVFDIDTLVVQVKVLGRLYHSQQLRAEETGLYVIHTVSMICSPMECR